MNIDEQSYNRILEIIQSDDSPVGIDAKKTHVIIIHMLNRIEQRLEALEKQRQQEDWLHWPAPLKSIQKLC